MEELYVICKVLVIVIDCVALFSLLILRRKILSKEDRIRMMKTITKIMLESNLVLVLAGVITGLIYL